MSKFFIGRPIVAMVIAILMVIVGWSPWSAAGGAVPEYRAAGGSGPGHLSGRRRADPGTIGGHAHRSSRSAAWTT